MSSNTHISSLTTQAIELLRQLVAFDSVSRNSNLPIIAFIRDYLEKFDVHCTNIPSPDGIKSNLLARIGPEAEGGLIFSGHTDVVPIDGQEWSSPPFTLTERDGKLYGRGTADMKAFIAVCLAMVPDWSKRALTKPIYLAFSYDEEIGCLGVPYLVQHIMKHAPKPEFVVIGEPTMMEVVTAHKGVLSFITTVHGLEAHSSQPHLGVNAVHIACKLVHELTVIGKDAAENGLRDMRFMPPYSTVHTGIIQGGTARNIIPKECRFHWEIRPLPGDDPATILERFHTQCERELEVMRTCYPGAHIDTVPQSHMKGVTLPKDADHICNRVMRSAKTNSEHVVSFGTEAGVFHEHGIPAIICGPGSIDQAHKPNEFIERTQIEAAIAFMLRMLDVD